MNSDHYFPQIYIYISFAAKCFLKNLKYILPSYDGSRKLEYV